MRGFATSHPSWGSPNPGAIGFASVEAPWGFHAMMFEGGLGASYAHGNTLQTLAPSTAIVPSKMVFVILDTQACLLDVPLGGSGFGVLGCLRGSGAYFTGSGGAVYPESGLAVWGGVDARLRWQSTVRLFLEVNVDAMIGTISDAVDDRPWWFEGGGSLGFQL